MDHIESTLPAADGSIPLLGRLWTVRGKKEQSDSTPASGGTRLGGLDLSQW